MLEKVKETVAEALGADIDTITAETSFKEDLGADSLDLFEMVMSLEDTCGVEIPTEDLETMVSVVVVSLYLEKNKNYEISGCMWKLFFFSEVTKLLGIQYPVIQGGMAWVAEHHLAAAVSEAGGLGLIGASAAPAEWVRNEIREAKKLTDKPFGVNIMLMSPYADEVAKVVAEEGVKVVTTGAGNPEKYMELWKNAGIRVIPVVASVALARRMERAGADAVVAEGCESGGHIGETTTMALVPQVADAVKIPVIAAGGIADGRGMAAAFMLGAEAVQMGTRFVASKEAVVHENYKQLVIKAKDIDTRVTGRTTGHPVRAIRNEMTRHYLELEKEGAPFEELEKLTLGGLRRAVVDGDVKTGSVMSGQIAGMVKDEKSCKEIIEQMMNEMEELLKGAPARL